ncbi:MAG: bifunctional pyr operon transcriptional regulator/uracil phosphoribosyltransferase PyrR [Bacteroidota bacterium]
MEQRSLLNSEQFSITINRLCYELIENHNSFDDSVIIGLQPRGIYLSRRIKAHLAKILNNDKLLSGNLDVTFYRDDFRRTEKIHIPSTTEIDFIVENKKVILIDDVLYTGRTIRAGLDAILSYGRPKKVELLVLIDRRYSRQLPIEPDYVGKRVDAMASEKVKVEWKEIDGNDQVWLQTKE